MNFTKIEIIGFKSFANKTEIRFDHGITGIVGPNGCGKSNVADAIRWVLGEQSPKSLRGSSMQDVIFNGTQNRKSLSYCEVSLFFDNSRGIFKSEPYDEVILTRKLFRNGDSEYMINKKPRKLKDIVNLLHECGLSKEGYAVIGQNKVTEILSSKPADRRAIFEEAVGIAKTKAQRLETERKLLKTEDNIRRFADICINYERQLAPLSRQADTAREYNELSEKLKFHEVNSYLCRLDGAADQRMAINARLTALTENLAVKQAEYAEQEKIYSEAMASLNVIDSQIKSLNDEILQKTVGLESQKGKAGVNQKQIEFFEKEIQRMKEENTSNQAKIETYSSDLAKRKSYDIKSENEEQLLIKKVAELGAKLGAVMEESDMSADIKSIIGSLTTEKSGLLERQQETQEKLEQLKERLDTCYKERAAISESISAAVKELSSLTDEIEASENGIKITNDKLAEVNKRIFSLNNSITSLEANINFYKELKESFSGFQQAVRSLMQATKEDKEVAKRVKGVVASVISTENQYNIAYEAALGGAIQHIITDNDNDAKYLIELLRRNGWGQAMFYPVASMRYRPDSAEIVEATRERGALGLATQLVKYDKYFEPVIRYLLGNTLIVDNLDNAVSIRRKYRNMFKIVTLDGDVLSPQGAMSGGSRKQNAVSVLSTDNKIDALEEQLATVRADYAVADKRKNQYVATLAELNNDLSRMNAEFNEKKQSQMVLKEQLSHYDATVADIQNEIESYKQVLIIINTRLDEVSRKYSDLEVNNRAAKSDMSAEAENSVNYYEELKKERDKLIAENTESQRKLATLKTERASNKDEIARLTDEISNLRALIRDNDRNIAANGELLEKLKAETEKLLLSDEDRQTVAMLRDRLKRTEVKKEDLQNTIESANTHREQANGEIQALSADKLKEEFNLEKLDADLDNAAEKLNENYGLTMEDCKLLKVDNYDLRTSNSEIEKLKRKIRGLGPINNTAIEEYESINAIYQDNMLQKQDLEKGAQDLRTGIKNLTDEMTTKFNAGFEIIRSNFRKIFKELFGGGSADLLLDYENVEDPLEAGVEIFAEPPGKKLQKISLLSGGEMALTAIAILFAILRLSPMPFCVLDEIEAALDEANVERFARYLKNFSSETQFIVITHKKVTMELADALFGVTMQEHGVSSIVSVELADINENTETTGV